MARVPRACAQPGDAPGLGVGFRPYPVQPPLVEQRGHVEPVAGGEREVAAEYGDVHRRPHRLVIRLRGVHDASLHRAEQFPARRQLIREVERDLHLAVRRLVERIDLGLHDVLGERGLA